MFGMLAPAAPVKWSVTAVCSAGRDDPGGEVPEQEPDPAERVLDVVPEDPEEEHVPAEVEPAPVHEHRGEDALEPGEVVHLGGRRDARALERTRVEAVAEHVEVDRRSGHLPEPDGAVHRDQPDGDDGEAPRRDVVLERKQLAAGARG